MNLTYDSITQPLQEWAADYGIPCKLIRDRLNRGWSVERAITEPMLTRNNTRLTRSDMRDRPVMPAKKARRYSHNGKCLTVTEWSALCGVNVTTLHGRLAAGWTMDHALHGRPASFTKQTPRAIQAQRITFNGVSLTLTGWAQRIGVSAPALRNRLRIGWPLERALTEAANAAPRSRLAKVIEFEGKALTAKEWARRIGIAECTLNQRLANPDWTVERALTTKNSGTYRRACRPRARPPHRPRAPMLLEISQH